MTPICYRSKRCAPKPERVCAILNTRLCLSPFDRVRISRPRFCQRTRRLSAARRQCLSPEEARRVPDAIDVSTHAGLRDRGLIGLMVFSFARIGAAIAMKIEDVFVQDRRLWVRLREKGGKRHEMPCHHNLESYLQAYLDGGGIAADPKRPLFRTIGRTTGQLTTTPLPQANAHAMIRRRAAGAGIKTLVGNHTFRATGITAYLKNGGTLENAAAMANHASSRTTQLYDRRRDEVSLEGPPRAPAGRLVTASSVRARGLDRGAGPLLALQGLIVGIP
jgi:integrase